MIAADVRIGGVYLTRVAGDLVPVRVLRRTCVRKPSGREWPAFVVERVRQEGPAASVPVWVAMADRFPGYLPKPRTAGQLRPLEADTRERGATDWHGGRGL